MCCVPQKIPKRGFSQSPCLGIFATLHTLNFSTYTKKTYYGFFYIKTVVCFFIALTTLHLQARKERACKFRSVRAVRLTITYLPRVGALLAQGAPPRYVIAPHHQRTLWRIHYYVWQKQDRFYYGDIIYLLH